MNWMEKEIGFSDSGGKNKTLWNILAVRGSYTNGRWNFRREVLLPSYVHSLRRHRLLSNHYGKRKRRLPERYLVSDKIAALLHHVWIYNSNRSDTLRAAASS